MIREQSEREREVERERLQGSPYIGTIGNGILGLAFFPLPPLISSLAFFPGFMAF